jgi:hypothetical protein
MRQDSSVIIVKKMIIVEVTSKVDGEYFYPILEDGAN